MFGVDSVWLSLCLWAVGGFHPKPGLFGSSQARIRNLAFIGKV